MSSISSKIKIFSPIALKQGCFAFIDPDDELCVDISCDDANKVRIAALTNKPMFSLFYKQHLKEISPYQILELIAQSRIEFASELDKEVFMCHLASALTEYDIARKKARTRARIATIASSCVGIAALGVAVALLLASKCKH